MENNNTFSYQYSYKCNREVEAIRKKYLPKETDNLEELKRLDLRVQTAGMWQSFSIGIVGCLVLGIAICFFLGVFGGGVAVGIPFAIVGVAAMIPAYPLYRHILKKTKEKLVPRIMELSDELIRS